MKALALLATLGMLALPATARAADLLSATGANLGAVLDGKYVAVTGSNTKFLEDHNVQDGADGEFSLYRDLGDDRSLAIDTFGQTGEQQGWLIGNYQRLNHYSLLLDLTASQRFYNARNGEPPQLSSGVPLRSPDCSSVGGGRCDPGTNDSRFFFGSDYPSIHRITTGANLDYKPSSLFHDVYLDFHFRDIWGQETTLKGGPVNGPDTVDGSGPGSVDFNFPGRKKVDYLTFAPFVGGRSGLGGINWQTDATYEYSQMKSQITEADFMPSPEIEVDRFRERNNVHVGTYDLVGSRFLRRNLYVYGGYLFSIEHNSPAPNQIVDDNLNPAVRSLVTRSTTGGDVQRINNSLGLGLLYRPHPTLVVTADTRAGGSVQSGEITERREEFRFELGNTGFIHNDSDRHWVNATGHAEVDWTAIPSTLVRAQARYTYRRAANDSTRDFSLQQARETEREDYANEFNRFEGGPSVRWNAGHARTVEAGYTFFYENMNTSINEIRNGFIIDDYWRRRHRPYLKGTAQLLKTLRGELRFEYVDEQRHLRAPIVDPLIVQGAGGGKTKSEAFSIVPSVMYQPDPRWSLYGSVSVAQERLTVDNLTQVPVLFRQFRNFEYDALTETIGVGVGYTPSDVWSASASYNYVHDGHRSVHNQLHGAEIVGRYNITKHWDIHGGWRYFRYDRDLTSIDDYRANVAFVGISAHL